MENKITCPVDFKLVNENKVRLIASFVFVISVLYVVTGFWPIMVVLAIDFFTRAFGYATYSLLGLIASRLIPLLRIPNKPIDQGPKRFAALIGFMMITAIVLFHLFGLLLTAKSFAFAIIMFSFLESTLGFCAGCYMYTFFHTVKRSARVA